jgi:hypothetical protein
MLGQSFAPMMNTSGPTRRPDASQPVQEAIRVLSLRMPQMRGGPAPSQLMAGPGAGGSGLGGPTSNPIIEQLLRALFSGRKTGGGVPGLPGAPTGPSRSPFPGFTFGAQPPSMPSAPIAQPPPPSPREIGPGGFAGFQGRQAGGFDSHLG